MKRAAAWMLSVVVALVFLAPLLWMLRASFSPEAQIFQPGFAVGLLHGGWTLQNYADAWRRASLGGAMDDEMAQRIETRRDDIGVAREVPRRVKKTGQHFCKCILGR